MFRHNARLRKRRRPPPLPKTGDLLPSQNGRGGERPPPPPPLPFLGLEERRARRPAGRARARGRDWARNTCGREGRRNAGQSGVPPCAGARPRRARSGAPARAGLRQSPEASAGPRPRRHCPIFTLLLILLTTPS